MIRSGRGGPRRIGRVSAQYALTLSGQLTERDRLIALDCYDHRVLTTDQLRRLHFDNLRTAQRRLRKLYLLRVVERVRPPRQPGEGSPQWQWLLDEAGAHVVAAYLGRERSDLNWRRDAALTLASSSALVHQLEVNEFFSRLADEARLAGAALREWWGERRLRETLGASLVPDGYGRVERVDGSSISFLLEFDRGTERPLERLRDKARRYAAMLPTSRLRERDPLVLLLVPSPRRAARAEAAVAAIGAPIVAAVWTPTAGHSPLAALEDAAARRDAGDSPPEPSTETSGVTPLRSPPPAPHD